MTRPLAATELADRRQSPPPAAERLDRLRAIIAERCVLTGDDVWLISPRGRDNTWLIDMRQALLDAEALSLCADLFWDRFAPLLPFQLGGLEIAAIPLVVALTLEARRRGLAVNGFILRKERKPYGVGKVLEGRIGPEPIFIVDDIMNSAGTLEKTRVLVESFGRRIDHAFVVVNYHSAPGIAWSRRHGINPHFFFTLDDFGLKQGGPKPRPIRRFATIWRFRSEKANHFHVVPKSSPLVAGGKVIFGSDRGILWALDTATGAERWRFETAHPGRKGIWSRPAAFEGKIYFGAYDGNLYCLDADTGKEVWRNADADWIGSSPVLDPDEGLLWIGLEHQRPGAQGSVAAFDPLTGEKRWERYLPLQVHATPAYSRRHRTIAIGSNDGKLHMFDAASGETRWEFAAGGPIKEAALVDDERGLVYVTSFDGCIRALDIAGGALVWTIQTPNLLYSTPLLVEDRLFVAGADKNLHLIDLAHGTNTAIWLNAKSVSTPVRIENSVFVGANGGAIFEVDAKGRAVIGRHQLPDPVTNRIAYCPETRLFFGLTYMNELHAFRRAR
jgi:outer membrane protein assembly factor BamB/orotate phosphoribosyltransferase